MAITLEELTDRACAWTNAMGLRLVLLVDGDEVPLKFRYASVSSIALEVDK